MLLKPQETRSLKEDVDASRARRKIIVSKTNWELYRISRGIPESQSCWLKIPGMTMMLAAVP